MGRTETPPSCGWRLTHRPGSFRGWRSKLPRATSFGLRANGNRLLEARSEGALGLLTGDLVLALNQAARIVLRRYVMQPHIARHGAEERNSLSNEHRHTRDDETLNQACAQESLNRNPSVDVEVVGAASREFGNDLSRRPGHLFHNLHALRTSRGAGCSGQPRACRRMAKSQRSEP